MENRRKRNRSHYIHRLSYSAQERLAGTFVLLAMLILVWLLLSSDKTRNLFEDEYIIYGVMDSIQAINEETLVNVSGLNVGHVINVDITDKNEFVVTMSILKKYQQLIRKDSYAELVSFKFALIGKSVISISVGSPELDILPASSVIHINESLDLMDTLEKIEPVLAVLQDSIQKTNHILSAIEPQQIQSSMQLLNNSLLRANAILNNIESDKIASSIHNVEAISQNTREISQQVRSGKGVVGSMIYNEQLNQDIQTSTRNLTQITEQMKTLLKTMQEQVYDIPELTGKIKPLLDEADRTIKATQQIWPLSGAIKKETRQDLPPPETLE